MYVATILKNNIIYYILYNVAACRLFPNCNIALNTVCIMDLD